MYDKSPVHPSRFVVLNLTPYYNGSRSAVHLSLPIPLPVMVKRLQSPTVDEKNSSFITWAGQSYYSGKPKGWKHAEVLPVWGGHVHVTVPDSEAALISLIL